MKFDDMLESDEQRKKAKRLRAIVNFNMSVIEKDIEFLMKTSKDSYVSKLENDIRFKIRLELAFNDLYDYEKAYIKELLLEILGFNRGIQMRKNSWEARVLFHQSYEQMAKNRFVIDAFKELLGFGRMFDFENEKWIRLIYADNLRYSGVDTSRFTDPVIRQMHGYTDL